MKKIAILILCMFVGLSVVSAMDIYAGAGLIYQPKDLDFMKKENMKDASSWTVDVRGGVDFRYIGVQLKVVPDHISKDFAHITADAMVDFHLDFFNFRARLGLAHPFTYDGGKFGFGSYNFDEIKEMTKNGEFGKVLAESKILISAEYRFADKIAVGLSNSFPFSAFSKQDAEGIKDVLTDVAKRDSFDLYVTYTFN